MSVDFVMPVRNEGPNIARALAELYEKVPIDKRVLIVYDSEDDDTLPVVRGLAYPGLTLVRNTIGRGLLNAIRAGFAAATADVVIVTMADLSDDVAVANEMVRLIEEQKADVVCASRYMPGGKQIGGPWLKSMLSRVGGLTLHYLAGFPTHDATNAFRAYRRTVLERFPIESTGGFEYSLELTAKAHAAGYKVTEVPAVWRDRVAGETAFKLWAWLPRYLKWYWFALKSGVRRHKSPL